MLTACQVVFTFLFKGKKEDPSEIIDYLWNMFYLMFYTHFPSLVGPRHGRGALPIDKSNSPLRGIIIPCQCREQAEEIIDNLKQTSMNCCARYNVTERSDQLELL